MSGRARARAARAWPARERLGYAQLHVVAPRRAELDPAHHVALAAGTIRRCLSPPVVATGRGRARSGRAGGDRARHHRVARRGGRRRRPAHLANRRNAEVERRGSASGLQVDGERSGPGIAVRPAASSSPTPRRRESDPAAAMARSGRPRSRRRAVPPDARRRLEQADVADREMALAAPAIRDRIGQRQGPNPSRTDPSRHVSRNPCDDTNSTVPSSGLAR